MPGADPYPTLGLLETTWSPNFNQKIYANQIYILNPNGGELNGSVTITNIDSINQKKHMVVRADKKPVVSTVKTPLTLSPGSSISLWAKFPAPPADIEAVSIYLPGVAPMEDIPISE